GNGGACAAATQCQSGFCADSVCCDAACNGGACDACSVAAGAPADGVCSPLSGNPCDDGNPCTQNDACAAGVCGGAAVTCSPADACHVAGACDPLTGACSTPTQPDGAPCDDGDPCTLSDTCVDGACTGGPPMTCNAGPCQGVVSCDPANGTCSLVSLPDGSPCPGGVCIAGGCVVDPDAG